MRQEGRLRSLAYVNSGGGFGIDYDAPLPEIEVTPSVGPSREPNGARPGVRVRPSDFVRAVQGEQRAFGLGDLALYVEPGRSLVAPFGVLLATVIQTKVAPHARWLMIDAGMNDLMRPALYQARHRIVPLQVSREPAESIPWRVVGPVCESSDDFGEHLLPREAPREVAILDAGAYGYVMANVYNGRQLPVEVFIRDGRVVAQTTRIAPETWVAERALAGA
jgi:diaminopimelate decarboxylase